MAASPRRESSLKVSLGDLYATRCATCGRMVVVDEVIWGVPEGADPTRPGGDGRADRPPLPLHGLPRPARRTGEPPGPARRRRPDPRPRRCRRRRGARRAARPLRPGRWRRDARRRAPRAAHAPPARRALGDPRPDRGRPACGAGRWPPCASRSCTRSCRPAGSRPRRGARRRCGSAAATSACRPRRPGASATRGSRSRTASASSAGSSSASRAARSGRSRRGSARTCAASGRGRRPRSSRSPARRGLRLLRDELDGYGRSGPDAADPPPARPAAGPARPRAARRRLPRDRLGARPRSLGPAAHRRAGRPVAARAVELAGGDDRPGAGGGRAGHGPRRPGGDARGRRPGGARRDRPRRGERGLSAA